MISIKSLKLSYPKKEIFSGLNLQIQPGYIYGLLGRNGTGKSTLLKIIAALDTADTGTVWVHKDVKVIMLQQDTAFENEKSIWDNVLRMDNPIVKVVNEYEMYLEDGGTDDDKLHDLIDKRSELNAWNF